MALDSTDKRILALLKQNARQSFSAIGREIGLSRTAVQDRVAKLEQQNVLRGYRAEICETQAEMMSAMLFIEIATRPCDQALDWLHSLEGVSNVMSLSGQVDAIAQCDVASPEVLSKLNDKIGASDLIASCTSHIVLKRLREQTAKRAPQGPKS